MIEMKHLNINFGNQVIFNDAHFKTCPGRITGIIGKSGCGKRFTACQPKLIMSQK